MKKAMAAHFTAMFLWAGVIGPSQGATIADQSPTMLPARKEFVIEGHRAFLIQPPVQNRTNPERPWVWYAPTLPDLPGSEENWMFHRFLAAGIAIAGIDVGESYGNPHGRALYSALYKALVHQHGLSAKPCLLARSRGGLMLYNWAVDNAVSVAGVAGIYPVCDLRSYPGLKKAAAAYGMTELQLASNLARHNPIDRIESLAKARVPVFHIHGDSDAIVPLEQNSAELMNRYRELGGAMTLLVIPGQGHNLWPGWFQNQQLVDFVIERAKAGVSSTQVIHEPGGCSERKP